MGSILQLTLFLLLVILTVGLMTGHPMQDELNLNSPTLFIVRIKCLHLTLTPCSISGVPQQPLLVAQHHFRTTRICIALLMLLLLVMFHGRVFLFTSMGIYQKVKPHLGWMQAMMSDFVTPVNLFTILLQIQILRMDLTMPHIRSVMLKDLVAIIILCQQIGLGNRQ